MTTPYNATIQGMVENILEFLTKEVETIGDITKIWYTHPKDLKDQKTKLSQKDIFLLVNSLVSILDATAPKVSKLKNYLKEIATICTQLNLHIP